MKEFRNGVGWYTKASVMIGFPEDDVCGKTGEILMAPKHTIGMNCPLKFETEE